MFQTSRSSYIKSEDGAWGAEQPDGTMNGIIGMLARDEADIGIYGFSITATRANWATPLIPQGILEYN